MRVFSAAERMLASALRLAQRAVDRFEPPEASGARDSQQFWNDSGNPDLKVISHWRGQGVFQNDGTWLQLGRTHMSLLEHAASWAGLDLPFRRVVEWGSGGGMNAIQLASSAEQFVGIDISQDSLDECARQLTAIGFANFIPVHIQADKPDAVLTLIPGPCDAFLSTWVFELLPSREYGLEVMRIAHEILRPGGIAVVHIRYHQGRPASPVRRRNYAKNWVTMTSYGIDEFWSACEAIGFDPLFVCLQPTMPELGESNYAYYSLTKKSQSC